MVVDNGVSPDQLEPRLNRRVWQVAHGAPERVSRSGHRDHLIADERREPDRVAPREEMPGILEIHQDAVLGNLRPPDGAKNRVADD